jgi:hypothetical protein
MCVVQHVHFFIHQQEFSQLHNLLFQVSQKLLKCFHYCFFHFNLSFIDCIINLNDFSNTLVDL